MQWATALTPNCTLGSVSFQHFMPHKNPARQSCSRARNEPLCASGDVPPLFRSKWSASRPSRSPYGKTASATADKAPGLDLYNPLQRCGQIFVLIAQD